MISMQTIQPRHATGVHMFKLARLRSLLSGALVLLVILSLSPTTAPAQATPDVDAGVQTFLQGWVAAWNAHDADAIMRLHAEDCATVNSLGLFFRDRKATAPDMQQAQRLFKAKDAHFLPLRILNQRSLSPDLIVLQAEWQVPSPVPQANDMTDLLITFILKRSGNGWLAEEIDGHVVDTPPSPTKK